MNFLKEFLSIQKNYLLIPAQQVRLILSKRVKHSLLSTFKENWGQPFFTLKKESVSFRLLALIYFFRAV